MILSLAILIRCIVKKKNKKFYTVIKKILLSLSFKIIASKERKGKERRNLRNVIKN